MTFQRIKPDNWSHGDNYTSDQANQADGYWPSALDKRGDDITGTITVDSGAKIQVARLGTIEAEAGGTISVDSDGYFTTASGSHVSIDGATVTIHGPTVTGAGVVSGSLTMSGTSNVLLASRSVSRISQSPPVFVDPSVWSYSGGLGVTSDVSLDGKNTVIVELDVPHNAVLTSVQMFYVPPGSHVGMPAILPFINVVSLTLSTNTSTTIATHQDTFGSIPLYEANRSISATGLGTTIDRTTKRYFASLTTESSTSALANTAYWGCKWTATITTYDEA